MVYACVCKAIPEKKLREHLEACVGPVRHADIHKELGGNEGTCCWECRIPDKDRLFTTIVDEHNQARKNLSPS